MTRRYGRRMLQQIAGAVAAVLFLLTLAMLSSISADAQGMPGMQMSHGPARSTRAVIRQHQRTVHLNIQNLAFRPSRIVVSLGTTIIWTNLDSFQHTTTSDRGLWDSGPLNPGARFVRVFKNVGTFTYHCTIHPFMHGSITVTK